MFAYHSFFGDPDDRFESTSHHRNNLRLLNTGFSGIFDVLGMKPLKTAIDTAAEATITLDYYQSVDPSPIILADLLHFRLHAQHLALSLSHLFYEPRKEDHYGATRYTEQELVQETIRLALLVYNNLVLYPLHPATGLADKLAHQLRMMLELSQRLCPEVLWKLHPKVLLWMLVLGGISIESSTLKEDKDWYRNEIAMLIKQLFGPNPSFEATETCLCEFLWLDWILSDEYRKFFAELPEDETSSLDLT